MKIKNKKTGAEYSSDSLVRYDALDFNDNYFFDRNNQLTFCFSDGWEEVVDETDFADKWHDLRKNPADLPSDDREVIVAGYYDYTICTEYAYNVDFYAAGQWQMDMEIVAWRDFPAFSED